MQQLSCGIHIELSATVQDIQQGEDQHRLVGDIACTYIDPTHGDSHHQQGEDP